jgi:hypothetical protein
LHILVNGLGALADWSPLEGQMTLPLKSQNSRPPDYTAQPNAEGQFKTRIEAKCNSSSPNLEFCSGYFYYTSHVVTM